MTPALQPFLHDLVTVLAAPTQALSAQDGDIAGGGGAQGIYHADVRVLSNVAMTVDGERPEHIATTVGSDEATFTAVLRQVRPDLAVHPDPTLRLDRTRTVAPGRVAERLRIGSVMPEAVELELAVRLGTDLAPMETIKGGTATPSVPLDGEPWGDGAYALVAEGAAVVADGDAVVLRWTLRVPEFGAVEVGWAVTADDARAVVGPAPTRGLDVEALTAAVAEGVGDVRLARWARQSLADLNGLRMTLASGPAAGEPFFAAGSPWYFTLFGRDSLWAARLLLPVDAAHAVSTLRTLASLQGRAVDPASAEQPGKIMHELRGGEYAFDEISLPPLYYGTIDATALWVCLLHDAWRAGVAASEIEELLPALEAALGWLVTYGDADGDGFLEYVDESGHGLTNQGWKDSGDSVRFADGSIATGPVALCEVQGYAYEAAVGGADLLDAFDRPGAERYRAWAATLQDRFRAAFWVERDGRRFPALALDGAKRVVDSTTSNIGHLLGTGLLSADEEELVAARLAEPDLDSGLGLRTMSSLDGGYSPLSYHCGSVWPHDTAIVIDGMRRAGLVQHAAGLVAGLLTASEVFDRRFPELWSGEGPAGVPYPASCRPQAWSAAAVIPVAAALRALG